MTSRVSQVKSLVKIRYIFSVVKLRIYTLAYTLVRSQACALPLFASELFSFPPARAAKKFAQKSLQYLLTSASLSRFACEICNSIRAFEFSRPAIADRGRINSDDPFSDRTLFPFPLFPTNYSDSTNAFAYIGTFRYFSRREARARRRHFNPHLKPPTGS